MFGIIEKNFIKYFLTSVEPNISQSIYSQSLGGYTSNSLVYPEDILNETIGLYDTSMVVSNYVALSGCTYINLGLEIMEVNSINSNNIVISQRAVNNLRSNHLNNSVVRGISSVNVFNNILNENRKQYRCFSIKNNVDFLATDAYSFNDVKISLKQDSRNSFSNIRFAIEDPMNDYLNNISTGGSYNTLIDSSLIGRYSDNHFINSRLRVKSGSNLDQVRTITIYNGDTGTFTLNNNFSNSILGGVSYEVEPSPAQRVVIGEISPIVGSQRVSEFVGINSFVDININNSRDHADVLQPNDLIYIWVEREIKKNAEEFDNNSFIIDIRFSEAVGS